MAIQLRRRAWRSSGESRHNLGASRRSWHPRDSWPLRAPIAVRGPVSNSATDTGRLIVRARGKESQKAYENSIQIVPHLRPDFVSDCRFYGFGTTDLERVKRRS